MSQDTQIATTIVGGIFIFIGALCRDIFMMGLGAGFIAATITDVITK